MSAEHDVVIVGGGLVGASLACALASTDARQNIALIEAAPYRGAQAPSEDDRSIALSYASRLIFSAIGVWDAIDPADIGPIHRIHISDRGRPGLTHFDRRDVGADALGYVVPARALGAALWQRLHTYPAIKIYAPAELTAMTAEESSARLTLKYEGGTHNVRARLVVGADGARSAVRTLLGVTARTVDYGQTAIVTNIVPERAHEHTAYERFTAHGPLALLPLTGRRCGVVLSVRTPDAQTWLALSDEEFLQRLQTEFGARLGRIEKIGKRQSYPLSLTHIDDYAHTRTLLIGNAAHSLHPVAGQGFNLGLRDVAVLAELIVDTARAGGDIGAAAMLRQYADWRRRDTVAMTRFTDGLIRVFSTDNWPLVLGRSIGLLAMDVLPPLKRSLLRRTLGFGGRLPRVLRGLPL